MPQGRLPHRAAHVTPSARLRPAFPHGVSPLRVRVSAPHGVGIEHAALRPSTPVRTDARAPARTLQGGLCSREPVSWPPPPSLPGLTHVCEQGADGQGWNRPRRGKTAGTGPTACRDKAAEGPKPPRHWPSPHRNGTRLDTSHLLLRPVGQNPSPGPQGLPDSLCTESLGLGTCDPGCHSARTGRRQAPGTALRLRKLQAPPFPSTYRERGAGTDAGEA